MKTPTKRQRQVSALARVVFATLVVTTAPAFAREFWPQRIPLEREWLLAERVAALDQLGVWTTMKTNAAVISTIRSGCRR